MARVGHSKSTRHGGGASGSKALRGSRAFKHQEKTRHKIVVEDLTGDKKQTQKTLMFRTQPPPGYTFIPAGNPEFTAALKQSAKKRGLEVLAVTTTPHAERYELSREVHRVGFHFPTLVVEEVCKYYGVELMGNGRLREEKDDDDFFRRIYHGDKAPREQPKPDQVTINTDAKQIIKDLFPNIPDNDLFKIIKTAFQLGDKRVGTADEIPLVRRAQLSVVAHIRHTYTNYDKLLRKVDYLEARQLVEEETLQKLVLWRGDNEDTQAMDDVLREVVVISDDEEDSEEGHGHGQEYEAEEALVQPVRRVIQPGTSNLDGRHAPIEISSDDEQATRYRYLPQSYRQPTLNDQSSSAIARQQSRHARWAQVRQDYRNGADLASTSQVAPTVIPYDEHYARSQTQHVVREPIYRVESVTQWPMNPPARTIQQEPSTFVRGADGKLYERIVTTPSYVMTDPQPQYAPSSLLQGAHRYKVDSRPGSPRPYQPVAVSHKRIESFDGDSNVLPSIETPYAPLPSPSPRKNPFEASQYRPSHSFQASQSVLAAADTESGEYGFDTEQLSKRRRVEGSPPPPRLQRFLPPSRATYQSIDDDAGAIQRRIVSNGEYFQSMPPQQHVMNSRLPQERMSREQPVSSRPLSLQDAGSIRYVQPAAVHELATRQPVRVVDASYLATSANTRAPAQYAPEPESHLRLLPLEDRQHMYRADYTTAADPNSVNRSFSDRDGRVQYGVIRPEGRDANDSSFMIDLTGQYELRHETDLATRRNQDRPVGYACNDFDDPRLRRTTVHGKTNYLQRID